MIMIFLFQSLEITSRGSKVKILQFVSSTSFGVVVLFFLPIAL